MKRIGSDDGKIAGAPVAETYGIIEAKQVETTITKPPPDTLAVAPYLSDMIAQLEAIATEAHLDLLAYFLGMAREEAARLLQRHES